MPFRITEGKKIEGKKIRKRKKRRERRNRERGERERESQYNAHSQGCMVIIEEKEW